MPKSLEELREMLARAQRLSQEGSYERILPTGQARSDLLEAQTGLREYTKESPDDEVAWRLQALAEECVTNFKAAITCLERAMELSGKRTKKDLKTLARLQEYAKKPPKRQR
jgi:hypothetical protein